MAGGAARPAPSETTTPIAHMSPILIESTPEKSLPFHLPPVVIRSRGAATWRPLLSYRARVAGYTFSHSQLSDTLLRSGHGSNRRKRAAAKL